MATICSMAKGDVIHTIYAKFKKNENFKSKFKSLTFNVWTFTKYYVYITIITEIFFFKKKMFFWSCDIFDDDWRLSRTLIIIICRPRDVLLSIEKYRHNLISVYQRTKRHRYNIVPNEFKILKHYLLIYIVLCNIL